MKTEFDTAQIKIELIAELICSVMSIDATYEIDSREEVYFSSDIGRGVIEINNIINSLQKFLMQEMSESNFKEWFIWDNTSDNSKKRCIEMARDSISGECQNIIYKVNDLAYQIENLADDKLWEEYLSIGKSDEILVRNTMYLEPVIDDIGNIAKTYLELPFRDKDFENSLLRIFYYAFANTAWFRLEQEMNPYHIQLSASITDFRSFVGIEGYQILNLKSYIAKQSEIETRAMGYLKQAFEAFLPFLIVLIPFWYLSFPNYLEKEFYLAFAIGLYFSLKIHKHIVKKEHKKLRRDRKIKDELIKFSNNTHQMMSFSVEGRSMPIGDLLKKKMISINFGDSKLRVPRPLIDILKRASRDNIDTATM